MLKKLGREEELLRDEDAERVKLQVEEGEGVQADDLCKDGETKI